MGCAQSLRLAACQNGIHNGFRGLDFEPRFGCNSGMLRAILVKLGYKALACGLRFPHSRIAADFNQWGNLIDLVRRLQVNVFLDVGANRGFFSQHLRMAGYQGRLISFEPIPEDCERISALATGDRDWTVCNYALGAESTSKQFQVNLVGDNQTVLSSFLHLKHSNSSRAILVQVHRLDEVLAELIGPMASPRVFLKMDTQGFDGQVMEGASGCLKAIVGIQSEIRSFRYMRACPTTSSPWPDSNSLGLI